MIAVIVTSSVCVNAQARPCPRATLVGEDRALVAQIESRLVDPTVTTSSTTETCERLVVDVRRVGTSVHLTTRDGKRQRTVDSTATAATLLTSWTAPALEGLDWDFGEPAAAPKVVEAEAAAVPVVDEPPPPVAVPEIGIAAPAPKDPTPLTFWIAGAAATTEASGLGGGAVVGAELGGAVTIAPTARLLLDGQVTDDTNAGANNVDIGVGAHVGFPARFDTVRVQPRVGLIGSARRVSPTSAVGPLACSAQRPCNIGEIVPPPADAFTALSVWAEASVAIDFLVDPTAAVGIVLSLAATPAHAKVGAPVVQDDPSTVVRDLPRLPRWRASLAFGLRFGGVR